MFVFRKMWHALFFLNEPFNIFAKNLHLRYQQSFKYASGSHNGTTMKLPGRQYVFKVNNKNTGTRCVKYVQG